MMDMESLRFVLDGSIGLVAIYLLHQVAGTIGSLQATLNVLVELQMKRRPDDQD